MKTHVNYIFGVLVALAILLALPSAPGVTRAQDNGPKEPSAPDAVAPGAMPIQGKLTNASGTPLNGTYSMTFKLYEVDTGGTDLCTEVIPDVSVTNGLFSTYMDHCYGGVLTGQKVWLGIKVGTDPEMTPRQVIYPVAYSLGLVPGVVVEATGADVMTLSTSHTAGTALSVAASAASGTNYGIYGTNASPNGTAGYFLNSSGGTGVSGTSFAGTGVFAGSLGTALRADSATGAAISAEGTGKITSTAKSYLWISGNGVRPWKTSDTTVIEMNDTGGAKIFPGSVIDTKNVMLPITITGPLYAQDVTISAVDIYWAGEGEFEGITAILMRRQTGVCGASSCYLPIITSHPTGSCQSSLNPTGCTLHYAPSANNVLTANSGILYMTIELFYGGDNWIEIGGVRLTLEHH